ncbi:unnamed protein product [Blepharisma stoltei]|uniref:Uncharacterized protein n=1 Tax=Blepharisma stoltei TaxID=1481888 RepID=A0AAU9JD40_9CILI|nr:unnamed protein product [Blepharisma stoltei]
MNESFLSIGKLKEKFESIKHDIKTIEMKKQIILAKSADGTENTRSKSVIKVNEIREKKKRNFRLWNNNEEKLVIQQLPEFKIQLKVLENDLFDRELYVEMRRESKKMERKVKSLENDNKILSEDNDKLKKEIEIMKGKIKENDNLLIIEQKKTENTAKYNEKLRGKIAKLKKKLDAAKENDQNSGNIVNNSKLNEASTGNPLSEIRCIMNNCLKPSTNPIKKTQAKTESFQQFKTSQKTPSMAISNIDLSTLSCIPLSSDSFDKDTLSTSAQCDIFIPPLPPKPSKKPVEDVSSYHSSFQEKRSILQSLHTSDYFLPNKKSYL